MAGDPGTHQGKDPAQEITGDGRGSWHSAGKESSPGDPRAWTQSVQETRMPKEGAHRLCCIGRAQKRLLEPCEELRVKYEVSVPSGNA